MSLGRNVLANYFGAGWVALMNIAFVPLYIRALGIEGYGLVGIFALIQGALSLLDLGLAPALAREAARHGAVSPTLKDLLRSAEFVAAMLGLLVALMLWLASGWLARHWLNSGTLDPQEIAQSLAIMGWIVGLRIVENVYRSVLIGRERQVRLNLAMALLATLRGLGAVAVLWWVSPTITSFFHWQAVVSVVTVLLLGILTYTVLPASSTGAKFSLVALAGISRFAGGAVTIAILAVVFSHIDKLLLSRLLSLQDYGAYAFAVVVSQIPLSLVGPTAQAFYPRFTQLISEENHHGLVRAYHQAAQLVAVLLGASTVVLIQFGREILDLWVADSTLVETVYSLVAVLALGGLMNGLGTIHYFLQLSAGWTRLAILAAVVSLVAVVPAMLLVVPVHGAVGAAWVWMMANTLNAVLMIAFLHFNLLRQEFRAWALFDTLLPVGAALLSSLIAIRMGSPLSALLPPPLCIALQAALVFASAMLVAPHVRKRLFALAAGMLSPAIRGIRR